MLMYVYFNKNNSVKIKQNTIFLFFNMFPVDTYFFQLQFFLFYIIFEVLKVMLSRGQLISQIFFAKTQKSKYEIKSKTGVNCAQLVCNA